MSCASLLHGGIGVGDAVVHHHEGGSLDVVEDIVEGHGEPVYLLGLEGGDEGAVQLLVDTVRDLVPPVLEPFHHVGPVLYVRIVIGDGNEEFRCLAAGGPEFFE